MTVKRTDKTRSKRRPYFGRVECPCTRQVSRANISRASVCPRDTRPGVCGRYSSPSSWRYLLAAQTGGSSMQTPGCSSVSFCAVPPSDRHRSLSQPTTKANHRCRHGVDSNVYAAVAVGPDGGRELRRRRGESSSLRVTACRFRPQRPPHSAGRRLLNSERPPSQCVQAGQLSAFRARRNLSSASRRQFGLGGARRWRSPARLQ